MAITMEELKRKAQRYDEALEKAKEIVNDQNASSVWKDWLRSTFPELKESKGEEIRKLLIRLFTSNANEKFDDVSTQDIIAWLEKQVPVDEDEIVEGIRRGVAISLMNHIDANSKEMCLSNMECEDIENAIIKEDWDKVYGYMKKKLEKQNERKQGSNNIKWNKNTKDNKPQVNHSVLMQTIYGIAEGEWRGEDWYQYRWSGIIKDNAVIAWIELSDVEKQSKELKVEEAMREVEEKVEDTYFIPKGCYAVIVGDEVVIKKGERKPAWSEVDNFRYNYIKNLLTDISIAPESRNSLFDWLKSLKDKVGCEANCTTKKEWSKEDEDMLDFCCDYLDTPQATWLQTLKQRIGG